MNLLDYFLNNHSGNLIHKPVSYFPVYERHFKKFCNEKVKVLEIGVSQGGSLKMWKEYFGCQSEIVGIDINDKCKKFEEERVKIYIGDQSDPDFLRELVEKERGFDIVIDDGGHFMYQQGISFNELFPFVNPGGVYLCEDTGTSYDPNYGGGYLVNSSFTESCKRLIDQLNACSSKEIDETYFTFNCIGMHFYDSIIVMDKGVRLEHNSQQIGRATI